MAFQSMSTNPKEGRESGACSRGACATGTGPHEINSVNKFLLIAHYLPSTALGLFSEPEINMSGREFNWIREGEKGDI